jgi:hypothetical protein
MTNDQEDLCRWLYVVAGFSRAKLAEDFEVSIAKVEQIVSTRLGEVLNPPKEQPRPNRTFEMNQPLKPTTGPRKLDDDVLHSILALS